jgi:hypothetical protein
MSNHSAGLAGAFVAIIGSALGVFLSAALAVANSTLVLEKASAPMTVTAYICQLSERPASVSCADH